MYLLYSVILFVDLFLTKLVFYLLFLFQPSGEYVSLQESVHLVSQGTTGLSTWQVRNVNASFPIFFKPLYFLF